MFITPVKRNARKNRSDIYLSISQNPALYLKQDSVLRSAFPTALWGRARIVLSFLYLVELTELLSARFIVRPVTVDEQMFLCLINYRGVAFN